MYLPLLNLVLETVPLHTGHILTAAMAALASILLIQILNRFGFMYDPA